MDDGVNHITMQVPTKRGELPDKALRWMGKKMYTVSSPCKRKGQRKKGWTC